MAEIDSQEAETEEGTEDTEATEQEEAEDTETEDTAEEAEPQKRTETPQQKKARLQREMKQLLKKNPELAEETEKEKPSEKQAKKAEKESVTLNDTQLDLLEVKGITEDEDIDIITAVMEKTGKPLREVLKDPYVVANLETNKQEREVRDATPGDKKRATNGAFNSVDFWYTKYKQSGELPSGMPKGMAEKVVNKRYEEESSSNNPFD